MKRVPKQTPPDFNIIYLTCLFLEILGLCFLALSIYLIPYILFNVVYSVPSYVIKISWWLDMHQQSTIYMYALVIFFPPFLAGLLCLYESRRLTARIERQLLGQDELSLAEKVKIQYSETTKSVIKVILATVSVFLVIWLVAYFI